MNPMSRLTVEDLEDIVRELRAQQRAAATARWAKGRPRQRAAYRQRRFEQAEQNWRRYGPLPESSRRAGPPIPPGGVL
jgi:hypothetical protein